MAEGSSTLPIEIVVGLDKASVGVAFAELKRKAEEAGRSIGTGASDFSAYKKQARAIDEVTDAMKRQNDIFKTAKIRSPESVARELDALRKAKDMWLELGPATDGYKGSLDQITRRTNILTEGNARARGSFHKFTAQLASLTFELTGALYGITAIGAALAAPLLPGIGLMKSIEDTQLGMAAILVSMSKINNVTPTLPQALAVSSQMMDKLVTDSIRYGTSIEALASTLRATLAPGLGAGLTIKQIQEIATAGTIAVKTIGLDSRQTVQEIRDLVAGGITAASSTLATSLGIKDSDIKRWKDAGELYERLMERLKGFSSAAEASTKTLSGAWESLKNKVAVLMSNEDGFTALKNVLISVSEYIGKIDEKTNKLVFNKDLIEGAKSYWDTLLSILDVIKSIGIVFKEISPAITKIFQTMAVLAVEVTYVIKTTLKEITTIATQMVALAHFDFKGAAGIGAEWKKEAATARTEVDKLTASILGLDNASGKPKGPTAPPGEPTSSVAAGQATTRMREELKKLGDPKLLKEAHETALAQFASDKKLRMDAYKDDLKAQAVIQDEYNRLVAAENKRYAGGAVRSTTVKKELKDEYRMRRDLLATEIEMSKVRLGTELVGIEEKLISRTISQAEAEDLKYAAQLRSNETDRISLLLAADKAYERKDEVYFDKLSNDVKVNLLETDKLTAEHKKVLRQRRIEELEIIYASKNAISDLQSAQQLEIDSIGKTTVEVEKLKNAREKEFALRSKLKTVIETVEGPTGKVGYREVEKRMAPEVRAAIIEQASAEEALKNADAERQLSFAGGWAKAFNDYYKSATNAAEQAKTVFNSVTKSMEDAMVTFVTTGKLNFKSLVDSIVSDLARIAVRSAISSATSSSGGGWGSMIAEGMKYITQANGGAWESGLQKFAKGGSFANSIVNTPTLFPFAKGTGLMGEAGPEAIMPLTRTPTGELGVRSSGNGGAVVNVIVNVDSGGNSNVQTSGEGMQGLGDMLGSAVKKIILDEMRPNGLLNNPRR